MADLVSIFCEIDDFCKEFESKIEKNLLSNGNGKRNRSLSLTMSEIMTISIYYHFSGYANFKDYYTKHVEVYFKNGFPKLVSYSRFIELRKLTVMVTFIFLTTKKLSSCTGISFIDSFKLESCHIKRESAHKTMKAFAKKGKTSMGWFYGMKVHISINHKGEITCFYISPGNVADNNEELLIKITKKTFGKLFGDKGYLLNKKAFESFYKKGIHFVTKIRKNMKNKFMLFTDKLLLGKRGIIECVGGILKEHLYMEHTRHRSSWGFFLHIFTSLLAYQMREKKPSLIRHLPPKLLAA